MSARPSRSRRKSSDKPLIKSPGLFVTGLTLALGGGAAASPVDEIAVTAATGGVGALLAPLQGPITGIGGGAAAILGIGLMLLSTSDRVA